jgi:uncharacterized protein
MLILALADAHGSSLGLKELAPTIERADLVLLAGDLTDFGGAREARALLAEIEASNRAIAAVAGNCDKAGVRELLIAEGLSADGRLVEAGGARVIGAGGSPLRSGLTPYERRESELAEALFSAASDAAERGKTGMPLVALSHVPPKGSGADQRKGQCVGSQALRDALDRIELVLGSGLRPILWVCGHIHESPCASSLGSTLVLNPGSLRDGRYALVSLECDSRGIWKAEAQLYKLK